VMAGFIAGLDHDTPDGIVTMADQLLEVGVDVPFLSILTPFRGTPLRSRLEVEGRILEDRGWEHYNGYNVAHRPALMTPDELLKAHRELWRRAFSPSHVQRRIARQWQRLSWGARWLSLFMNGFYGLKRWRGNEPVDAATLSRYGALPLLR